MKGPMTLTEELVACCERHEPDPGPQPGSRYFTDAEYEAAAAKLIEQAPPGPLWVFAYGSLIWKPAIETTDHRHAVAHGWHRAFCLKLTRWRGSPVQPGLMIRPLGNWIVLSPPLTISKAEIDESVTALRGAIRDVQDDLAREGLWHGA